MSGLVEFRVVCDELHRGESRKQRLSQQGPQLSSQLRLLHTIVCSHRVVLVSLAFFPVFLRVLRQVNPADGVIIRVDTTK